MASTAAAAAADEPVAHGIAPPEPEPEEAKVCAWCGATENLKRCGGCRKKWFCDNDKKCLKEAWTTGGHKQECKASQRSKGEGPKTLPAAMKTAPKWVQGPPAAETSDFRGPQMSDSFDSLPLDEDDECAICMGDPMSRSGQGVVSLQCSHRFHRDCVAALRNRKVAFPCTFCDPDSPPPAWDDALRRYVRVRLLGQLAGRRPPCCDRWVSSKLCAAFARSPQIERQVEQKRASWGNLDDDQQETVEELTAALKAASAAEPTAAELLESLRLS